MLLIVAAVLVWNEGTPARLRGNEVLAPELPPASPGARGSRIDDAGEPGRIPVASDHAAQAGARPAVPAPSPGHAVVHGRCVDAETGAPRPGEILMLASSPRSAMRLARSGASSTTVQWRATSGDTGEFAFAIEPDAAFRYELTVPHRQIAGKQPEIPELAPGSTLDVGEICIRALHAAEVHVRDEAGVPVPGQQVVALHPPARHATPWRHPVDSSTAVTGPDGVARFAGWLPAGKHRLLLPEGRVPYDAEFTLEVVPGRVNRTEIVVPAAQPVLAGAIVDAAGRPQAGRQLSLCVRAGASEHLREIGRAISTADGRFALFAQDAPGDGLHVRADVPLALPEAASQTFVRGQQDLRLVVAPLGGVELDVVAAAGGAPVERFAVGFTSDRQDATRVGPPVGGHHPRGRLRFDGFAAGSYSLIVVPGDPALTRSAPIPLEIRGGVVVPLRVELPPARELVVEVVYAGEPVAAASVELLEAPPDSPVHPQQDYAGYEPPLGKPSSAILSLARALTDGAGVARLPCPLDGSLQVRVRAGGFPVVVAPVTGMQMRIELARGGQLRVRVVPEGVVAQQHAMVRALRARGAGAVPELHLAVRRADGSDAQGRPLLGDELLVTDLAVGEWIVGIQLPCLRDFARKDAHSRVLQEQRVLLRVEPVTEVTFDLAAWVPGRLRARVPQEVADGGRIHARVQPAWMASRDMRGIEPHGSFTDITLTCDREGALPELLLPPGRYQFLLAGSSMQPPRELDVLLEPVVEVPPAGLADVLVAPAGRTIVLTVRAPDGALLRDRAVVVNPGVSTGVVTRTDGEGRLRFPYASPGLWQVFCFDYEGSTVAPGARRERVFTTLVRIDASPGLHEVEARLVEKD